jgi:hypothetical protein
LTTVSKSIQSSPPYYVTLTLGVSYKVKI